MTGGGGSNTPSMKVYGRSVRDQRDMISLESWALTWQYASTGSMTCFHTAFSAACSSFADTSGMPALITLLILLTRCLNAEPISEPRFERVSSNSPEVGESRDGDRIELSDGFVDTGGEWSIAKNAVIKAYSAVALSISTRRRERSIASRCSFYKLNFSKDILGVRRIAYIGFIIHLVCKGNTRARDVGV